MMRIPLLIRMPGMTIVRISDSSDLHSLFVAVRISFQKSIQTVMEDSNSVPIRLQSHGQYGRRFSVSFACIEVRPVEAKGTIIVLDCAHCRMCAC